MPYKIRHIPNYKALPRKISLVWQVQEPNIMKMGEEFENRKKLDMHMKNILDFKSLDRVSAGHDKNVCILYGVGDASFCQLHTLAQK